MVEKGQIYRAAMPTPGRTDGHHIRIKVVSNPYRGYRGYGKVDVVTIENGREKRFRAVELAQFHATATTRNGKPRRTGYILEAS